MIKTAYPFAFLLSLHLLFSIAVHADVVLQPDFSKPLSTDQWLIDPKDSFQTVEGQLVMNANSPDATAYAVLSAVTTSPLPSLNFITNSVKIKLGDITIKGSSAPDLQVFIVTLFTGNPTAGAVDRFQLRLAGDGDLQIGLTPASGTHTEILSANVALPLKSITLTVSPDGVKLATEDASGIKQQTAKLSATDLAPWQGISPYLGLETHRSPGAGDAQVTLGSFTVESTPTGAPAP